jgi:hypothetical protein
VHIRKVLLLKDWNLLEPISLFPWLYGSLAHFSAMKKEIIILVISLFIAGLFVEDALGSSINASVTIGNENTQFCSGCGLTLCTMSFGGSFDDPIGQTEEIHSVSIDLQAVIPCNQPAATVQITLDGHLIGNQIY